jgi:hypothetical protein
MYFGAENGAGGAGQERHRPGIRRGTSRESAGEPTDDLTEAPAEELPREPADALTGDQPMLCRGFSRRSVGLPGYTGMVRPLTVRNGVSGPFRTSACPAVSSLILRISARKSSSVISRSVSTASV